MTAPDVRAERSIVEPTHDLELIEHLDWEHTPQCEHEDHEWDLDHSGPGYVLLRVEACHCKPARTRYYCRGIWQWAIRNPRYRLRCRRCHWKGRVVDTYTPLGWVE